MHLLRCLVFIEAHNDCYIYSSYIDTKSNHLADDLSRNRLSAFLSKVPSANRHPTPSVPTTAQSPFQPPSRLDISALEPSVRSYFQQGLAPSTQKTYKAAMKRFNTFCITYNVVSPFPVTEQLLCSFAAFFADQGLAPQTGKSYLSAVRNLQISMGFPDPREQSSLPILKRVQAGISRARMLKGSPPRIRLPITANIMEQIY